MAVETDKYELPLYVADTLRELADWSGFSIGYVLSAIAHGYPGKKSGMKFLRIEIDFDYSTGSKIRLAVEGGKLYISVADGAWVGQITLTRHTSGSKTCGSIPYIPV